MLRKQVPGRRIGVADVPQIFVSTGPAEIIVTEGAPQYTAIAATQLQFVANSDAALFRHRGDGLFYYLVSGRWFSAASWQGPWVFATSSLPADFARIPADGPRGFVLASVPGTVQAQEALIQAQIPQQATLNAGRREARGGLRRRAEVRADPGTTLLYAVNTSSNVLQSGSAYYACYRRRLVRRTTARAAVGCWPAPCRRPSTPFPRPARCTPAPTCGLCRPPRTA